MKTVEKGRKNLGDWGLGPGNAAAALENPKVQVRCQDEAVVVSAAYTVRGDRNRLGRRLKTGMEELAGKVAEAGGIIGHVKAAVDILDTELYSVTDRVVEQKKGEQSEMTVRVAAIFFLMETEAAGQLVREMFIYIEETGQEAGQ
ncbi:MAG: hypothetical protein Q4F41_02080 [Eubacteriales bacterium]|nr:hypothetical protein [Eubacteriales bacterium]